jgi:molybdopterin converting factor small subunit
MVKVSILNIKGHHKVEMSVEEAENLIREKGERYFIVDEKTGKVVRELKLRDNQEIALVPKVTGGM